MENEDNFPQDIELIEFFGVEPKVLDQAPNIPWIYNELKFHSVIGEDEFECTISDPAIELTWRRNGEEVQVLGIEDARSIRIQLYPGGSALVVKSTSSTLRVQLRPRVHVTFISDSR